RLHRRGRQLPSPQDASSLPGQEEAKEATYLSGARPRGADRVTRPEPETHGRARGEACPRGALSRGLWLRVLGGGRYRWEGCRGREWSSRPAHQALGGALQQMSAQSELQLVPPASKQASTQLL